MTEVDKRISTYGAVSTELALLSDQGILKLLSKATPIGTSIGGTAALVELGGGRIWCELEAGRLLSCFCPSRRKVFG